MSFPKQPGSRSCVAASRAVRRARWSRSYGASRISFGSTARRKEPLRTQSALESRMFELIKYVLGLPKVHVHVRVYFDLVMTNLAGSCLFCSKKR